MLCSLLTDERPSSDLGLIHLHGRPRIDDEIIFGDKILRVVQVTPVAYPHDPSADDPAFQIIVSPPSDPFETSARMQAIVDSMQLSQITHDFEERVIVEESE